MYYLAKYAAHNVLPPIPGHRGGTEPDVAAVRDLLSLTALAASSSLSASVTIPQYKGGALRVDGFSFMVVHGTRGRL